MRVSDAGRNFIQQNEGFVAHVYDDNGRPAIGFGHDLQPGENFTVIGLEQAVLLLTTDLEGVEEVLNKLVPVDCTQGQFDALADFAYNLGVGALRTMLGHGWGEVPTQMPRWNNVNGKPNSGLAARRAKEVEMFNGN